MGVSVNLWTLAAAKRCCTTKHKGNQLPLSVPFVAFIFSSWWQWSRPCLCLKGRAWSSRVRQGHGQWGRSRPPGQLPVVSVLSHAPAESCGLRLSGAARGEDAAARHRGGGGFAAGSSHQLPGGTLPAAQLGLARRAELPGWGCTFKLPLRVYFMLCGERPRSPSMGTCRVGGVKGCCKQPPPPAAQPTAQSLCPGCGMRFLLSPLRVQPGAKLRVLGRDLVRRQILQIPQILMFLLFPAYQSAGRPSLEVSLEFLRGHHQLLTGDFWSLLLSPLTYLH